MGQLSLVCLLVLSPVGQTPASSGKKVNTAEIRVKVPEGVRLFVSDVEGPKQGKERVISTAELTPGQEYFYLLRAEWTKEGKTASVSRKIVFKAGDIVEVDWAQLGSKDALKPDESPEKPQSSVSEMEKAVLELSNREREKAGLAPLRWNDKLGQAARMHSENMARLNQLGHVLEGKGPDARLGEVGYKSMGWGENCAAGQRSAADALNSWMNSPGHRSNILKADFKEIGVGIAPRGEGGFYFTQVFATPAGM